MKVIFVDNWRSLGGGVGYGGCCWWWWWRWLLLVVVVAVVVVVVVGGGGGGWWWWWLLVVVAVVVFVEYSIEINYYPICHPNLFFFAITKSRNSIGEKTMIS